MKLRIKDNSIRLRLTQSEVTQLRTEGRVEAVVRFGPGQELRYALEASPNVAELTAYYEDHALVVALPEAWVPDWVDTDRVGFDGLQQVGERDELMLLVEKDFECLHKRPDEEDAFPHPLAEEE